MSLTDLLFRRSEPRWMNQEPPPYGYGGESPRTALRVIMCCNKCEEKVREEIAEVYGVQEILTDQVMSEVVVYGFADTHQLLKKARKVDKRADILSSDSFTLHHKHGHKHNRIHHKHRYSSDGHGLSAMLRGRSTGHGSHGGHYPVEIVGSPRYNSSFHQASSGYGSRYGSVDPAADYQHSMYQPQLDYRPRFDDGYRSEPDRYRPQYLESRGVYDEYRPDLLDPRYHYGAYRPSQSYPSRLADERNYSDSRYLNAVMNPDYLKQMDYY